MDQGSSYEVTALDAKESSLFLLKNDSFLSQLDRVVIMLNLDTLKTSEKALESHPTASNPLKIIIMRNLIEIQRSDASLSQNVR